MKVPKLEELFLRFLHKRLTKIKLTRIETTIITSSRPREARITTWMWYDLRIVEWRRDLERSKVTNIWFQARDSHHHNNINNNNNNNFTNNNQNNNTVINNRRNKSMSKSTDDMREGQRDMNLDSNTLKRMLKPMMSNESPATSPEMTRRRWVKKKDRLDKPFGLSLTNKV